MVGKLSPAGRVTRLTRTQRIVQQQEIAKQQREHAGLTEEAKQIQQQEFSNIGSIAEYKRKYERLPSRLKPFFTTPQEFGRVAEESREVERAKIISKIEYYQQKEEYYRNKASSATNDTKRDKYRRKVDIYDERGQALRRALERGASFSSAMDYSFKYAKAKVAQQSQVQEASTTVFVGGQGFSVAPELQEQFKRDYPKLKTTGEGYELYDPKQKVIITIPYSTKQKRDYPLRIEEVGGEVQIKGYQPGVDIPLTSKKEVKLIAPDVYTVPLELIGMDFGRGVKVDPILVTEKGLKDIYAPTISEYKVRETIPGVTGELIGKGWRDIKELEVDILKGVSPVGSPIKKIVTVVFPEEEELRPWLRKGIKRTKERFPTEWDKATRRAIAGEKEVTQSIQKSLDIVGISKLFPSKGELYPFGKEVVRALKPKPITSLAGVGAGMVSFATMLPQLVTTRPTELVEGVIEGVPEQTMLAYLSPQFQLPKIATEFYLFGKGVKGVGKVTKKVFPKIITSVAEVKLPKSYYASLKKIRTATFEGVGEVTIKEMFRVLPKGVRQVPVIQERIFKIGKYEKALKPKTGFLEPITRGGVELTPSGKIVIKAKPKIKWYKEEPLIRRYEGLRETFTLRKDPTLSIYHQMFKKIKPLQERVMISYGISQIKPSLTWIRKGVKFKRPEKIQIALETQKIRKGLPTKTAEISYTELVKQKPLASQWLLREGRLERLRGLELPKVEKYIFDAYAGTVKQIKTSELFKRIVEKAGKPTKPVFRRGEIFVERPSPKIYPEELWKPKVIKGKKPRRTTLDFIDNTIKESVSKMDKVVSKLKIVKQLREEPSIRKPISKLIPKEHLGVYDIVEPSTTLQIQRGITSTQISGITQSLGAVLNREMQQMIKGIPSGTKDILPSIKLKGEILSLLESKQIRELGMKPITRMEIRLEPRMDTRLLSRLEPRIDTRPATRLKPRTDTRLATRLQTRLATRLATRIAPPPTVPVPITIPKIPDPIIWIDFPTKKKKKKKELLKKEILQMGFFPDFTTRILGLKPQQVSLKQAEKAIKQMRTGFEIRRGAILAQ